MSDESNLPSKTVINEEKTDIETKSTAPSNPVVNKQDKILEVNNMENKPQETEELKECKPSPISHTHHQKRPAPKPPQINECDENISSDDKKLSQQENQVKDIPTNISTSETVVSRDDTDKSIGPQVNDIKSISDEKLPQDLNERKNESAINESVDDSEKNIKEQESTTSNKQLGTSTVFEVTVSPNHSTIIKNLESECNSTDMAHVSIVTIDDNGKDVMIQTAQNDSTVDVSEIISPYQNNNSDHIKQNQNISNTMDEVVIVRNEDYPPSDVIIVSNEYIPSVENSACNPESEIQGSTHQDVDDRISIQTSSSDNSANPNDFSRPKIKVNVNLVSESEQDAYSGSDAYSVDTQTEYSEVAKTRVDQVPIDSSNKKVDLTSSISLPNGTPHSRTHGSSLKRELSDSGSFFSVSSDKENNGNATPLSQPVVLRKRRDKVIFRHVVLQVRRQLNVSFYTHLSFHY